LEKLVKSNKVIAEQFKRHKSITDRGLSAQRANSELCDAFYEANYLDVNAFGRVPVQINKCQPYVKAVNGLMIQNRQRAKYTAMLDSGDRELYSRNANVLHTYIRNKARAAQIETQQNRNVLIKGYGAIETAMTYEEGYSTTDPNGEFVMEEVTDDCGWDPMARKPNLTDRRWDYYRRSFSLEDALKKFQDSSEEDFEAGSEDTDGGGFKYDPDIYPYDRSKLDTGYEWNNEKDKTVWVYFYTWYDNETFYRAENPIKKLTNPFAIQRAMLEMDAIEAQTEQEDSMFRFDPTAETLTFNEEVKAKLEELFEDLIECFPYTRKVFYRAVISGEKVFTKFRLPSQKGSTVKFKTGDWYNKSKIWTGMINPMMEPTRYYNKSLTALMYTIDANSKGGFIGEEGITDDHADVEARINKTDAMVWVKDGGIDRIKPKKEAFTPTGYEQIIQLSDQAISDTMGFDLATLVSNEQNKDNALLHRQLVKQVKSTLAEYFDADQNYLEEHARLMLDLMRIYAENNVGSIVRILGDEGDDFLRISQDMFAPDYDIEIQEAPETDEDKQEQAQIFFNVGDKLVMAQDPSAKVFYATGVKLLPLDSEYKKTVLQVLEGGEDPRIAQLQAQIQTLTSQMNQKQMQLIDAQIAVANSTVDKNMADVNVKAAGVAKTAEEIDRLAIENKLAAKAPAENINLSI
jgi:hypothetical protein